jgi:antitoxin (DNA-binding transcriptional repressor) of toxin-antitoxin stability system
MTVGVREFREGLASYLDQTEPVTVTRHGEPAGLFIPIVRDRKAAIAAYVQSAKKVQAMLAAAGVTEDEVVADFIELRKSGALAK